MPDARPRAVKTRPCPECWGTSATPMRVRVWRDEEPTPVVLLGPTCPRCDGTGSVPLPERLAEVRWI